MAILKFLTLWNPWNMRISVFFGSVPILWLWRNRRQFQLTWQAEDTHEMAIHV